jgi:trimeric autotransporter adhesin
VLDRKSRKAEQRGDADDFTPFLRSSPSFPFHLDSTTFSYDAMKRLIYFLFLLLAIPVMAQERQPGPRMTVPLRADIDDQYWDSRFDSTAGLSGPWYSGVAAIARAGNLLYAAGQYSHAGGIRVNNIAAFDGARWHPLVEGNDTGSSGAILALATMGNDLYAAGFFDSVGGVHTGSIARWDGAAWHPLGPGLQGQVMAMLPLGTDLYVGGSFRIGEDGPQGQVAVWNGTEWYMIGSRLNGSVHAIEEFNGSLYIGGAFDSSDGLRTGPVARYAWGSGMWRPFAEELRDTLTGAAVVWALAADETDLFVGGRFNRVGDRSLGNIVRLADESSWESLGTGVSDGEPAAVYSLAVTPDELYAGGTFGKAGGRGAGYVARWIRSSAEWKSLGSGVSECFGFECNTSVGDLYAEGDDIYVGGNFTVAGGKPSLMIGRWSSAVASAPDDARDMASPILLSPTPFSGSTAISFTLAASAPVRLSIVDLAGKELAILVDRPLPAGDHQRIWDASAYPAGVYLCRLEIDGTTTVAKMIKR